MNRTAYELVIAQIKEICKKHNLWLIEKKEYKPDVKKVTLEISILVK